MTEFYRFFGGPAGSVPEYTQVHFSGTTKRFLSDGYIPGVDNELIVTESTPPAMSVVVSTGEGWIQGYHYINDAAKTVTIPDADPANPRIDRIVLRLDTTTNFQITAEVLGGTPSGTPTAPALTQTSSIYEISLAQVAVGAGVTSIVNANITDERDTAFCGKALAPGAADADDLTTHTGSTAETVHGSAVAATANKLVHRDASGRAKVAEPAVDADIATKKYVDDNAGGGEIIAIIEDQKAQNTNGGTFEAGADRTRVLNTMVFGTGGQVSLASNWFTITPVGTQKFLIKWSAPVCGSGTTITQHKTLLYRTAPSAAEVKRGESGYTTVIANIYSNGAAVVTISEATTYEIRHRCAVTQADTGLGRASNFGIEVYTRVEIYRIS